MAPNPESILNPTIELGNFIWTEPVTTFTDCLVALVCWYAVYRFSQIPINKRRKSVYALLMGYFLLFAIGMTSAAWLGHGFQHYIGPEYKTVGWLCAATGLLFLQIASLRLVKNMLGSSFYKMILAFFLVEWAPALFIILNPSTRSFMVTQVNSAIALIICVVPLQFINFKYNGDLASRTVLLALVYSVLPGFVFNNQIGFGKWFNHHDISHVLMAGFMLLMFLATSKLALNEEVT